MAPQKRLVPYNGIQMSTAEYASLQRSKARRVKIDESALDRAAKNEPSKGVKRNQEFMGRKWIMYAVHSHSQLI
jgi:hypothetical protein